MRKILQIQTLNVSPNFCWHITVANKKKPEVVQVRHMTCRHMNFKSLLNQIWDAKSIRKKEYNFKKD